MIENRFKLSFSIRILFLHIVALTANGRQAPIGRTDLCNIDCSKCDMDGQICDAESSQNECSCCLCDHQTNKMCEPGTSCDPLQQSACIYGERDIRGICKRTISHDCIFNGIVYEHATRFTVTCRYRCECYGGLVTCQDVCLEIENSIPPPLSICPNGAELIPPRQNQCCREWACKGDFANAFFDRIVATLKKRNELSQSCNVNIHRETPWSSCSATCGMGVSTRMTNKNIHCMNVTETRYCYQRDCKDGFRNSTRGRACKPTVRSETPVRIKIALQVTLDSDKRVTVHCLSKRKFRPRFCGICDSCCRPNKSKTKRIEFLCSDNSKRIKMYEWIKSCSCSPNYCKN